MARKMKVLYYCSKKSRIYDFLSRNYDFKSGNYDFKSCNDNFLFRNYHFLLKKIILFFFTLLGFCNNTGIYNLKKITTPSSINSFVIVRSFFLIF